jgi:hypothetical protein
VVAARTMHYPLIICCACFDSRDPIIKTVGCLLIALVKMGSVECWSVFILLVVGHVVGDECVVVVAVVVVVVVEFVGWLLLLVELVDGMVFFFCFGDGDGRNSVWFVSTWCSSI